MTTVSAEIRHVLRIIIKKNERSIAGKDLFLMSKCWGNECDNRNVTEYVIYNFKNLRRSDKMRSTCAQHEIW